jgi:hypothetical protein
VVPVDSVPTLDVGTNQLFQALDPLTRPRFRADWREEGTCKPEPAGDKSATGFAGTGGGGGASGSDAAAASGPGVNVSFSGDIGPYHAEVVSSTSPDDPRPLKDWLAANNYYLPPEAGKLIDDYVKEGKHFVAIKLQSGRGINEIAPLVMKFVGPGPCVPLRLTSIAAIADLRINLWVLADNRVVPQNYYEIKVNPTRIDWLSGGGNYDALVKTAANEAGGNAFVTDYAGPASIARGLIDRGTFSAARLAATHTPPEALNEVTSQGIVPDGTLITILRTYVPEPAAIAAMGISEANFYNSLAFYWQSAPDQFMRFNAQGFAAEVDAKIIQPIKRAQALLDRYRRLTRLGTFISPEEMSVDPLFMTNTTLPDVAVDRVASAVVMCGNNTYSRCQAPVRLELPDGQTILLPAQASGAGYCYGYNQTFDRKTLDAGPALEIAYKREAAGEGASRFDNRAVIRQALDRSNAAAKAASARPGSGPLAPFPPVVTGNPGTGTTTPSAGGACAVAGGGAGLPLLVMAAAVGLRLVRRRRRP